jgi:hypothetical protein
MGDSEKTLGSLKAPNEWHSDALKQKYDSKARAKSIKYFYF